MLVLLKSLLGWVTGDLTQSLTKAYEMKLKAETEAGKLASEERIKTLQAKQAIIVAEQAHGVTRFVRPAFAFVAWVYFAKIVLWDKVLGMGVTDPLGPITEAAFLAIIGSYFISRPFEQFFSRKVS